MFGDNPLKEIPDSEKPKGFLYQKVYAKWLIAFAGPFVNLIFTLLAFFLLAFYGLPSLPPQIGGYSKKFPGGKKRAFDQGIKFYLSIVKKSPIWKS